MMMKRSISLVTALCLLSLCACAAPGGRAVSPASADGEMGSSVSFTDSLGSTITLEEAPQRVAALIGSYAETWVLAGDAAKNRGELLTEEVQMSMDPPATQSSLRRIKAAGTRVLPGHDGWVTLKEGEVLAEGGNDKRLVFGQGVTVNSGRRELLLHMD